jgi:hypothetical protein
LVQRLQSGCAQKAVIREFGVSAACLKITRQLDFVGAIELRAKLAQQGGTR